MTIARAQYTSLVEIAVRYLPRMLHVLRTEGAGVLLRKLRRRLHIRPLAPKGPPTLLTLVEPFDPIAFPHHAAPRVSVVIAIQRPLRAIHHCLAALAGAETRTTFEVVLVAGTIDDRTRRLARYPGTRLIQSPSASGPAAVLDQGARAARGDFIVFLSDDTQVQPGWLDVLVQSFEETPDAGILGSRLLYPDGRQREAGRRIAPDGSMHRLGRLDDPDQPAHGYRRVVDACSPAALAIRTELFRRLDGFDPTLVDADELAVGIEIRRATDAEISISSILMGYDARFLLYGLLKIPDPLEGPYRPERIFFFDDIDEILAQEFLGPASENRFNRRVEIGELPADTQGIDDIRRVFAERPEPLLAFPYFLMPHGIADADADLGGNTHEQAHVCLAERPLRLHVIGGKDSHGFSLVHDGSANERPAAHGMQEGATSWRQGVLDLLDIVDQNRLLGFEGLDKGTL